MTIIYSNHTNRIPHIAFECEHSLDIFGNLLPKNPEVFYADLIKWIDENEIISKLNEINIGINRARHRGMVNLEKIIRKVIESENLQQPVTIVWIYSRKSLGLSAGRRLSKRLNYPFGYFKVWRMLEMYR